MLAVALFISLGRGNAVVSSSIWRRRIARVRRRVCRCSSHRSISSAGAHGTWKCEGIGGRAALVEALPPLHRRHCFGIAFTGLSELAIGIGVSLSIPLLLLTLAFRLLLFFLSSLLLVALPIM
jgi:hypothetical protein